MSWSTACRKPYGSWTVKAARSAHNGPWTPNVSPLAHHVGTSVFYYRQKTDFDPHFLRYATLMDCPGWGHVFAWDQRDVYVEKPQSCGGTNCGGDYTGFYWSPMGVRNPQAFTWLAAGYGSDGLSVYDVWYEGPLDGARPAGFRVLLCGDARTGFIVGQDGERLYRDGKLVTVAQAFEP